MGPSNPERAKSGPDGDLGAAIAETFGSFQSFQEQFTKSAVGLFGSGFVYLVRDRKSGGQLAIKQYPNQDTPVMDGELPIVGLDVWEHALVATNTLLYRMPLSLLHLLIRLFPFMMRALCSLQVLQEVQQPEVRLCRCMVLRCELGHSW
jgi:Iron/manganese superoxide dismutases, C-terminal domain